jgi:hypothetical protein
MALAINKNILLRSLPVAAASMAVLAAHPSEAAIIGGSATVWNTRETIGTLDVKVLNSPPPIVYNGLSESQSVQAFQEKQNVIISENINVKTGFGVGTQSVLVPVGTLVSSDFVFFDSPGSGGVNRHFWEGEITFDQEILGIIANRNSFTPTTTLLGLEDVTYNFDGRGLDFNKGTGPFADSVTFNGKVLSFSISTAVIDPIRVITAGSPATQAVPEPLTILGTGTALGFIPLLKKAASGKQKKPNQ